MAKRPCGLHRLASCVALLAGNAVVAQAQEYPPPAAPLPPPAELLVPLRGQPFRGHERGVVRLGDTLLTIAQRYGLTLQELLRLNPGLDTARLVVGTQIRLPSSAQHNSGMVLGPSSTDSEVPPQSEASLPSAALPARFDDSLASLVNEGVIPLGRDRLRNRTRLRPESVQAHQQFCSGENLSEDECRTHVAVRRSEAVSSPAGSAVMRPLSQRETALLQRIRANPSAGWRQYGLCKYDWQGWRLHANNVRTTSAECGPSLSWTVAVSCQKLLVNRNLNRAGWQGWAKPAGPDHQQRAGEDEMVAALCANLTGG